MSSPKSPSAVGFVGLTATIGIVLVLGSQALLILTNSRDPFHVGRMVVLSLLAFAWLGVIAGSWATRRSVPLPRAGACGALLFLAVAVVGSTIFAKLPMTAFWGHAARSSGALTFLSMLVVTLMAVAAASKTTELLRVIVVIHGLVVTYLVVQLLGADPIDWRVQAEAVETASSTFGNPNFTSGYLGITCPAVLWLALASPSRTTSRVASGVLLGFTLLALGEMASLQGQVASATLALVLAAHLLRARPVTIHRLGVASFLALGCLAVPFLGPGQPWWLWIVCPAATLGLCEGLNLKDNNPKRAILARLRRVPISKIAAIPALGLVVSAAVLWDRLIQHLKDGFEVRFLFWESAWNMFLDQPVIGFGLASFRSFYFRYRSPEAAWTWRTLNADDPHSMIIGLLIGGGLILLAAYLLVHVFVARAAIERWRNSMGDERILVAAIGSMWIGAHAQSLVAVDSPVTTHLLWVTVGLLLVPRPRSESKRKHSVLAPAAACVLFVTIAVVPLSRPLRAEIEARNADHAVANTDGAAAMLHLQKAQRLLPSDIDYLIAETLLRRAMNDPVGSAQAASRAMETDPWSSSAALLAARALRELGDTAGAIDAMAPALANDPHGGNNNILAYELYVQSGRLVDADEVAARALLSGLLITSASG